MNNDPPADPRKVCQVCGEPEPTEYQMAHMTSRGFYIEDDKYDLCPGCGRALIDGLQAAIPEIVNRKSDMEDPDGQ